MNIKELKKEFKKILKEISKIPYTEQINFLIKKIAQIKKEELKILTILYLDYVITKKNEKGIRFVIPKIEELKKVANTIKIDKQEGLEDLIKLENNQKIQGLTQNIYNNTENLNDFKKNKYQHKTDYVSDYKQEKRTGYEVMVENNLYLLTEEQRTAKLLEYAFNPQKKEITKELKLDYI